MPHSKPKPAEVATEAKRIYIPYIQQKYPEHPPRSIVHADSEEIRVPANKSRPSTRPRIAVINGDPVDVTLDWCEYESKNAAGGTGANKSVRIPVVNMANEKRAGGDWESGLLAPEENLCRRSNLVHCLSTQSNSESQPPNYPIPPKGGIYSPHVVVFRSGPNNGYSIWRTFKSLPVISVAPVKRPKLDEAGLDYSFTQEKELMKEKMRMVLRIAAAWQHKDLCMGTFGGGAGFRNPVKQLAAMWREILFTEPEFQGVFANVVFAIESTAENNGGSSDYEIFKQEFDPANVFKTAYRP